MNQTITAKTHSSRSMNNDTDIFLIGVFFLGVAVAAAIFFFNA